MKAKDTEISVDRITNILKDAYLEHYEPNHLAISAINMCLAVSKAQAEDSFKAGQREVVKWVEKNIGPGKPPFFSPKGETGQAWQAQCKKWKL